MDCWERGENRLTGHAALNRENSGSRAVIMKASEGPANALAKAALAVARSSLTSEALQSSPPRLRRVDDCFSGSLSFPHWWPGHMARSFAALAGLVERANLIVQLRDARIPFSSANPQLDSLIGSKRSLLVFNKEDLISPGQRRLIAGHFKGTPHFFTSANKPLNIRENLLKQLDKIAPQKYRSIPRLLLVVGYPNVGKSSLIGNLRRSELKKAGPKISPLPGETRSISGFLISDSVFLLDSPGITQPRFEMASEGDREKILNLSACGLIKDELLGIEAIARYILFALNRARNFDYLRELGISIDLQGPDGEILIGENIEKNKNFHGLEDIENIITAIQIQEKQRALALGRSPSDFSLDRSDCLRRFLAAFRLGRFGPICLDPLGKSQPPRV